MLRLIKVEAAVDIPKVYREPVRSALAQSAILLVLAAFILDFGVTLTIAIIVMAVFWSWVLATACRRPHDPASLDIHIIRYGLVPGVICVRVIASFVWYLHRLHV